MLIDFREREEETERENIDWLPSLHAQTRKRTHSLSEYGRMLQSIDLHWPGQYFFYFRKKKSSLQSTVKTNVLNS